MATDARRRRARRTIGRYGLLVIVAIIVLFPLYSALMAAQKPLSELGSLRVLVPERPELGAFDEAFNDADMSRYLLNSAIVSIAITAGQVLTSILAGYAFAALRFPGKAVAFYLFMATLMVPAEATVVVNYDTVQTLGWIDTYQALIVPFLAFAVGTFLLRQAFLGIPRDLRDAATVDGQGHLGFLWRIAIPLSRPTIAALSLFSFLLAWNQYLWPLLVTNSDEYRTAQIGLKQLANVGGGQLSLLMAGTMLATLPILVLLVVFERQLIRGLTSGAVKG